MYGAASEILAAIGKDRTKIFQAIKVACRDVSDSADLLNQRREHPESF